MPEVLDVRSAKEWEQWLRANHATVPEGVWLRMFPKASPDHNLSWDEAVDVAICYGWIDGQSRKHDDVSRVQKFTPRRKNSGWSKINVERTERLIKARRMRAAGRREIERAKADGRWDRAYSPPSRAEVPDDFIKALRKNKKALAFFETLNKRNTYPIVYRLQTAKTPETRAKRMVAMIEMFERGEKFHD
ncbi:MAG TPA: YdeI/OmpD-associated family protein [Acidimicrobiales bacterium]|nr:YdeI/OmpD-associated family protein [Acidimicrobiales bacterium]